MGSISKKRGTDSKKLKKTKKPTQGPRLEVQTQVPDGSGSG